MRVPGRGKTSPILSALCDVGVAEKDHVPVVRDIPQDDPGNIPKRDLDVDIICESRSVSVLAAIGGASRTFQNQASFFVRGVDCREKASVSQPACDRCWEGSPWPACRYFPLLDERSDSRIIYTDAIEIGEVETQDSIELLHVMSAL